MKKGQIITLGVAAICGIGAVLVMSNFMSAKPKELVVEKQINTTQVLVAKTEVGLGQIVSREHFRWQDWPQGAVAAGYIQNRQMGGKDPQMALIGSVARAPILKDEPITANKLVKRVKAACLLRSCRQACARSRPASKKKPPSAS